MWGFDRLTRSGSRRWKTAWVIGARTGIGLETAKELCNLCDTVAISARSEDKLSSAEKSADNIHAFVLDVTNEAEVTETANKIERQHGNIELVVISSGVWHPAELPHLRPELFRQSMDTNYIGVVNVLAAMTPRMAAAANGHIAIISSVAGYRGLPNAAAYAPTKAALINLAECLQPQLRRMGIAVSLINPGFVETPMTSVNKFPMPFIQTPQAAAKRIVRGLDHRAYEIAFPKRLVWLLKFFRILPNSVYFWIVNRFILSR